ncbi:MAG: hypothetical protein OHK0053_05890 [Microscillaceae bacterium]
MRITYNAPLILSYTLICVVITALDTTIFIDTSGNVGSLSRYLFTVYPFGTPPMSLDDPLAYFRFFSHCMGHAGWAHLVGNFSFILLIGPILEEKYGTKMLASLILVTALITGILNALFFNNALLGASGIVFMMILLVSFANSNKGTIPLTFVLVALLYLGQEIYNALQEDQISQFAHIIGGVCGGIFGYLIQGNQGPKVSKKGSGDQKPLESLDLNNLTNL